MYRLVQVRQSQKGLFGLMAHNRLSLSLLLSFSSSSYFLSFTKHKSVNGLSQLNLFFLMKCLPFLVFWCTGMAFRASLTTAAKLTSFRVAQKRMVSVCTQWGHGAAFTRQPCWITSSVRSSPLSGTGLGMTGVSLREVHWSGGKDDEGKKWMGNEAEEKRISSRKKEGSLGYKTLHKLLLEAAHKGEEVTLLTIQLLCSAVPRFQESEERKMGVSRQQDWFVKSVADRLVLKWPTELTGKRDVMQCIAQEVIHHGDRLPVADIKFLVSCLVTCGYRESSFLSSVGEQAVDRLGDWMEDLDSLSILLASISSSKKDVESLCECVHTRLSSIDLSGTIPQGYGQLQRHLNLFGSLEKSDLAELSAVMEDHSEKLSCEEVVWSLLCLVEVGMSPSSKRIEDLYGRIMHEFRATSPDFVKSVVFLTHSLWKSNPSFLDWFDQQGVFQSLEEHLVKNLDNLLVNNIADCVVWLSWMDRCSSAFLSSAGRVLVEKRDLLTDHVAMSYVCNVYAWSDCRERRSVVSSVGENVWTDLRTKATFSEDLASVPGRVLDAYQKVGLCPSFLSSAEDVLVKCEGKLSAAELKTLTFALLQFRFESCRVCEFLVEDVDQKWSEDQSSVSPECLLNVAQYATLCRVDASKLMSNFNKKMLTGRCSCLCIFVIQLVSNLCQFHILMLFFKVCMSILFELKKKYCCHSVFISRCK